MRLFWNTFWCSTVINAYDIGCIYPEQMLEPFAARAKIIGFTGVYSGDTGLETPVAVHQGQAFSLCDVNCLSHHDGQTLNGITMERPLIVVPEFGHNSWSRMMCIAQCYAILFEQEGNSEALETIADTWKLNVRGTVEDVIKNNFLDNYGVVKSHVEQIDYDPLTIGRLVAYEINLHLKEDGWNMDGSQRYDPISRSTISCTANCIPYRDTYGYFPRNHPGNHAKEGNGNDSEQSFNKFNVTGTDKYWQPLMEDDGRGYMSRQEHVTPHIGFHGRYILREPSKNNNLKSLPDPKYDYYEESLLVIERLKESAQDQMKWDKISFYDKKFLVRLLIQESMKTQFDNVYTFEDEILFTHGIGSAEYDSVLEAWREKVLHDLVRPTTVIQRWGQHEIETFNGNRNDPEVETIHANDLQAFIRVMPHSEFPSGSSCICAAYEEFVDKFTEEKYEDYLKDMYWGFGGIDFGCDEKSVLDPSQADFLGCKYGGFSISSMKHLSKDCADSRLWGGMHFTASISAGQELCAGLGSLGFQRINRIRNNSSLGSTHVKNSERPICRETNLPSLKPSSISLPDDVTLCTKLRRDLFNDCDPDASENTLEISCTGRLSISCLFSIYSMVALIWL